MRTYPATENNLNCESSVFLITQCLLCNKHFGFTKDDYINDYCGKLKKHMTYHKHERIKNE